ncbi:uncharacterized protein LOC110039100 [Phalaenopsis equestris]|uniref:uncharacterized protein LOC110039100 n=1 Tax=Phalaenopsis equestris TaxID=78828 RepID=UPI0009E3673A|nr:uncharacterized protein LOC110039100 [Phalaenopsis equestris]
MDQIYSKVIKIYWKNPSYPHVKVNTYGSFTAHIVGIGGVFRDYKGRCIMFFKAPIIIEDALEAEKAALYWAIKMAVINRWTQIQAEVDSSMLIEYMTGIVVPPWHIQQRIIKIKHLTKEIQINYCFTYREGNKPANYLAIEGVESQRQTVATNPTQILADMLKGDKLQIPYLSITKS